MGHQSRPAHATGMPKSPSGDAPEDFSTYGTSDLENPPLLLAGWKSLFDVWKKAGHINTTDYTVKYLSGITVHGGYYVRDKRIPDTMNIDGTEHPYDVFLFAHELVELGIMKWVGDEKSRILIECDMTGKPQHISDMSSVSYLVAHQVAEAVENALVRAAGLDLQKYNAWMQNAIDWLQEQPLEKSPTGITLAPMKDCHDEDTLNEIVKTGGPVSMMMLPPGVDGGETDAPYLGE